MFAVSPDFMGYTGYTRLVQAGWDALVENDPLDLQIRSLTESAGVSKALFHKHFPNLTALLGRVAGAGLAVLLLNLKDEDDFEGFAGSWVRFANARPRHYTLMFSPQFAEHPEVTFRMDELGNYIRSRAALRLSFVPTRPQIQTLFAIIHGAASLVAAGFPRQSNQSVSEPIDAYLKTLK